MAVPFSNTLAFLDFEEKRRSGRVVAVACVLLAAWALWLGLSKSTVYVVSEEGRLLASGAASPVQSPVAGLVANTHLVLGAEVKAGEVLVELDAEQEKLRLEEQRARLGGTNDAIASLERILDAQRALAKASESVEKNRVTSVAARAKVAAETAALVKQQEDAILKLKEASLVSGLESLKAAEDLQRQQGQAQISSAERALAVADFTKVRKESELRSLALHRELVELRALAATTRSVVAQLEWEIARRMLRAPVDGTVADVRALPKGAAVSANELFATIVPKTAMRWVAHFSTRDAVGRIRNGQTARIRLDAFPWTAYGPLTARVTAVGSEPRDQRVRVELEITSANGSIPLSHGMTGVADVEVEQIAPARLLLRLAGQTVQEGSPPRSAAPSPSVSAR